MRRGEVRWAAIGPARRPVLILTRDTAIGLLTKVTVAPATRTIRGIPTEIRLGPEDGMPAECTIALDNVTTIPKAIVGRRITSLPASLLDEVCEALGYALGR